MDMDNFEVIPLGPTRFPRFIIGRDGLYWTSKGWSAIIKQAVLYACSKAAQTDCRALREAQREEQDDEIE